MMSCKSVCLALLLSLICLAESVASTATNLLNSQRREGAGKTSKAQTQRARRRDNLSGNSKVKGSAPRKRQPKSRHPYTLIEPSEPGLISLSTIHRTRRQRRLRKARRRRLSPA